MTYRILSLDGGGAWALIEVDALIDLYGAQTKGHDVLSHFDLAAANSGGSLVLAGLVENLTLKDLRDYFADEAKRSSIFSRLRNLPEQAIRDLIGIGPKYSTEAKLAALRNLLPAMGGKLLADAAKGIAAFGGGDVHLLIVGFDYNRNRARFFRSAQAGSSDVSDLSLAEAVHASTNAPINYFDKPASFFNGDARYWDGGITGCNNPMLAALTEAVVLGEDAKDVIALSLGTGTVQLPLAAIGAAASPFLTARPDESLKTALQKLAHSILDDPPDAATFMTHVMTGGTAGLPANVLSRVTRMSPLISPAQDAAHHWIPPEGMTEDEFTFLCDLDVDAVAQNEVDAIARCSQAWINGKMPNQPIRFKGDTLEPQLGYGSYGAAKRAWNALCGP